MKNLKKYCVFKNQLPDNKQVKKQTIRKNLKQFVSFLIQFKELKDGWDIKIALRVLTLAVALRKARTLKRGDG